MTRIAIILTSLLSVALPSAMTSPLSAQVFPKADANQVDQWLRQLDADEFATREMATARLLRMGPQAIPPLRSLLEIHPSLEAKYRARWLLREIDLRHSPVDLKSVLEEVSRVREDRSHLTDLQRRLARLEQRFGRAADGKEHRLPVSFEGAREMSTLYDDTNRGFGGPATLVVKPRIDFLSVEGAILLAEDSICVGRAENSIIIARHDVSVVSAKNCLILAGRDLKASVLRDGLYLCGRNLEAQKESKGELAPSVIPHW